MDDALDRKSFFVRHAGLWIALLLSFIFLYPTLNNEILLWDDEECITQNELIRELNSESIFTIFSTLNVNENYHPLTVTSWAIDYQIAELDPAAYHQHNLFLHLLNTFLVYCFILMLMRSTMIATIVALLFGLHPMHVESVAWLAARKDVLYSFYFLLAMMAWVRFVKTRQTWVYVACIICFILSCLAKGMAITLPVILLAIDYFLKRTDWKKALLEKVPFFIITILIGYVGYLSQQDGAALDNPRQGLFFENLFVAAYGSVIYMIKLVVPYGLSAMHPFPEGNGLPWYFYAAIVPILVLLYFAIKHWRTHRFFLFGLGFFFVSASPVLQVLPFGQAVYSERYTYIPYLGLFLILAVLFKQVYEKMEAGKRYRIGMIASGFAVVLVFGIITFNRSKVWKNDATLWTDVIEKYPDYYYGWANRALYYFKNGDNEKALKDYNKTLKLEPKFFMGYNNRGMIYRGQEKYKLALADFNRATALKDYPKAYVNKGELYLQYRNDSLEQAFQAFNKAIELNEKYAIAWYNRGVVHVRMNKYDLALSDLEKAEELGFRHQMLFYMKGLLLTAKGDPDFAYRNFVECIGLNPQNVDCKLEIGIYYFNEIKYIKAIKVFEQILQLQPDHEVAKDYMAKAKEALKKMRQR